MAVQTRESSILKADNRAFGDQVRSLDEVEVCPACKGKGVVLKKKQPGDRLKLSAISDSAISRRPRVARYPPMHLPSCSCNDPTPAQPCKVCSTDGSSCATAEKIDKNFEETVRRAVMKLCNHEWDVKKKGLEECLQIAQTHPDEIDLHMNQIYRTMRFLVTNHRPKDTLFVCQIARRFFALLRSSCKPEFDELVTALLGRTADSSLNVRCYVNDALDKMVTYMPTSHALRPLVEKGCVHKNPLVRTATIRLLSDIVTFRTPTALFTYPYLRESCQKILENGAKLLTDSSLGTRAAAKNLFLKLVNHEEFNRAFDSCGVDGELKKRIDRILANLKEQNEEEIESI